MQAQTLVAREDVRAALDRILESATFAGSERRRRLLEYLVGQTLADGGATLKEFSIGVDVYGRDPNKYDPREDATVRVDIARLRKKLQEYYEKEGLDEPLRLELPRGSYSISFQKRSASQAVRSVASRSKPSAKRLLLLITAATCCLAVVGVLYRVYQRRVSFQSIVVLPFLDLSPNHADEYLSDGLTDELTGQLAHIPGLRVVARTSAYAFKGKPQDVRKIGEQLHAGIVAEGSIQRSGDRLRINVQLNRASDGFHLWSETYDRSAGDLFRVEDEVSQSVAAALHVRMAGIKPHAETADVQAHTLYLQARYFWNKRTLAGIRQALDLLGEAVRRDPSYALAYSAQAECYATLIGNEQMAPNEAGPLLLQAAHRALAIDDSIGEAHAAIGNAEFFYHHDHRAAEQEFQRAIDLNPNYATVYQWYGGALMGLRRFDEARAKFRRARDLDPLALIIPSGSALLDYFERRSSACIAESNEVLQFDPDYWLAHYTLGICNSLAHNYADAIVQLKKAYDLSGQDQVTLSDLVAVYAAGGKRDEAERALDDLRQSYNLRQPATYTSPFVLASAYAALGDRRQMFEMLAEAEHQHASGLMELAVRPQFDAFRSDPEFRALLARLQLPAS